jgi:hypothetical protein
MNAPLVALLALTSSGPSARAAGAEPAPSASSTLHNVPRATSSIRVDGLLDDAGWREALALELAWEVQPGENVTPPVRTEVLAAYDDAAVYFAFRAFDPNPRQIRAHLANRDALWADDWVAVVLDTFNDERRSFDLFVNPLGIQADAIETETSEEEWDGIWESAGRVTTWGYAVEMRVPFSTLRFQRSAGPQTWGFDAVRSYPRAVRHHIGLFPRDRNSNCYLCQSVKVRGFEGGRPGRNLELTPTLTGVRTETREGGPPGSFASAEPEAEAGLTVRWGITPSLTSIGTVNPDFSQVEADALQLDINEPFALQYPEKRPFFMEGTDFFATRLPVVYTRTVRDPAWGLKLSGKEAGHTIAGFAARDEITNIVIPGSQSSSARTLARESTAAVLRYKRDLGSRFTLGGLATGREAESYFNRVAGLDADLRLSDTDRVQVQWLGSATRDPASIAAETGQRTGEFRDWAGELRYAHDTRNLDWWAMGRSVGDGFRADLGFMPQVDYRLGELGIRRTWYPKGRAWYTAVRASGTFRHTEDQAGALLVRETAGDIEYEGPLQSHLRLRAFRRREAFGGQTFTRDEFQFHNCMSPTGSAQLYVNVRVGDQIDYANVRLGERLQLNSGAMLRLGRHVGLDADATWERMREGPDRLYTATIAQATLAYQFTTRIFLRTILQWSDYWYNSALYLDGRDTRSRRLATQALFSYKLNPQTVFFLGYSDVSHGQAEVPLTRTERTVFAKIGYAWLP